MTTIGMKMMEIDHQDDATPCKCCSEPIELGMRPYLDIRVRILNNDDKLGVILYHNWYVPDTMYVVFGQLYRILGLLPQNPFLQWLGIVNEAKKPQN